MEETPHCSNHLNIPLRETEHHRGVLDGEKGYSHQKIGSSSLEFMQLFMVINYLGCYTNNYYKRIISDVEIALFSP